MTANRTQKYLGLSGAATIAALLGIASQPVMADVISDFFASTWKKASEAVAAYAENTYNNARSAASSVATKTQNGDFDGVADEIIKLSVGMHAMQPFRDTLLDQVNEVAKRGGIGNYTQQAIAFEKSMETTANAGRAQIYKNLYNTYKGDGKAIYDNVKSGNLDFSEYYKYSLYYAVAHSDWSNPNAAAQSAEQIGRDQYAAYSWYQSHFAKGATIGYVRQEVGLTDQAIEDGVKELLAEAKRGQTGPLGALIATEFFRAGKSSQCSTEGDYERNPNGYYCNYRHMDKRICGNPNEQHTVSLQNKAPVPVRVNVHVVSTQSHCQNNVCDLNGILQPGQGKGCAVFGRSDAGQVQIYVQAWDPRGTTRFFLPDPRFLATSPADGVPYIKQMFDKAAGNKIELRFGRNGELCMDAGNVHTSGCN